MEHPHHQTKDQKTSMDLPKQMLIIKKNDFHL
jgi:hypothetical protein